MPSRMLPPSIPGGQPNPPMPTKPKRSKRPPSKNQMGPKPGGQGGFAVAPPAQMGGQPMKKGGRAWLRD